MYTRELRSLFFQIYRPKKAIMSKFIRWQYGAQMSTPHTSAKFPGPNHVQAHEKFEVVDQLNVSVDHIIDPLFLFRLVRASWTSSNPKLIISLMWMETVFLISTNNRLSAMCTTQFLTRRWAPTSTTDSSAALSTATTCHHMTTWIC